MRRISLTGTVFGVVLPLIVGALTVVVGVQANRISTIANSMQANSIKLTEQSNAVSEAALQLSKESLKQMELANSIAEQSAETAQTSVEKLEEANRISANSAEISSRQLALAKDLSRPQFGFSTSNNGIVTRYDITSQNVALINVQATAVRDRRIFAFSESKTFSRDFPYITFQVQAKTVKSGGSGVVSSVAINDRFEAARHEECKALEKSLVEKWHTDTVFVNEVTVVKLSYRTNASGETNTYFVIDGSQISLVSRNDLQNSVLDAFQPGAFLSLTLSGLSERINNEVRMANF